MSLYIAIVCSFLYIAIYSMFFLLQTRLYTKILWLFQLCTLNYSGIIQQCHSRTSHGRQQFVLQLRNIT